MHKNTWLDVLTRSNPRFSAELTLNTVHRVTLLAWVKIRSYRLKYILPISFSDSRPPQNTRWRKANKSSPPVWQLNEQIITENAQKRSFSLRAIFVFVFSFCFQNVPIPSSRCSPPLVPPAQQRLTVRETKKRKTRRSVAPLPASTLLQAIISHNRIEDRHLGDDFLLEPVAMETDKIIGWEWQNEVSYHRCRYSALDGT